MKTHKKTQSEQTWAVAVACGLGRSNRGGSVVAGRGEIGEWRKRSAMEEENGEWRKMGDRRCGFVVAGLGGSVMASWVGYVSATIRLLEPAPVRFPLFFLDLGLRIWSSTTHLWLH
ncbi:hypothetical protein CMV_027761 [Castanea mollissima]|uniref:Uncharacterized protein n=1 Tax=Castanea mollissima TaxID=60419 RepID=A0A8J4V2H3_9ROSI|nr:hypothetical protein CMV_027761 [Castanea mollissima]